MQATAWSPPGDRIRALSLLAAPLVGCAAAVGDADIEKKWIALDAIEAKLEQALDRGLEPGHWQDDPFFAGDDAEEVEP